MDKRIALRFDIDSVSCVRQGLAGLSAVAHRYAVPVTLFVSMGRAIQRGPALLRMVSRHDSAKRMFPMKRLGFAAALQTLIMNPRIGCDNADVLSRFQEQGHELGLHGGRNHAWWQRHARSAGIETIRRDLGWSYDAFARLFGAPAGFAAPGFVWSEATLAVIDEKKFQYASDMDGLRPFHAEAGGRTFSHWQVPVTVCGASHTPLIEWACLQKQSEQDFLAELTLKLSGDGPAVLYGHPCLDGVAGIAYLTAAIEYLLDKGFCFVRMRDLVPTGPGVA